MLQNKSMLVDLTICRWSARAYDKKVSAEVETAHAARDAGRYNKQLIDKIHLAEVNEIASQMRNYHYSRTHVWTDKGQRLLPSALFMDYRQGIADFKSRFMAAANKFVLAYPLLVQDARVRLGTMYSPADYPQPQDISRMFDVQLEIMPVPDAYDFRVDVAKEAEDEIREQITKVVQGRYEAASKDCWVRVREVVERIAEQCGKEKGRIHDSLMDNASDLVSVLSGLNITGDPELIAIEADIRALIVKPDAIRKNQDTRKRLADGAADILSRMNWG